MPQTFLPNNSYWFIFQNDKLLLSHSGAAHHLIPAAAISDMKSAFIRQYTLTSIDNNDIFCAELSVDFHLPDTFTVLPLRKALEIVGDDWYTIAVKAYSIINWDKNHQYCGRCGIATETKAHTFERHCPACSLVFYPRISPSIIVFIKKDDQVLMARSHHFTPGAYGLIAGFVEGGESLEDTVHREVMEEVGITIKNLTYFGSQAWPFPDSLMIAFTAEYESGDLTINHDEIEAAGWYRYDKLPGRPSSKVSISGKLLDFGIHQMEIEQSRESHGNL